MSETALAVTGARLVDGTGATPIEGGVTVLVEGDRITAVGTDVSVPEGARVIDAGGKTVMPGLIDCHLHLFGISGYNFMQYALEPTSMHAIRSATQVHKFVEAGYTLVRDCGSDHALQIKAAIEEGVLDGPRLRAVGRFMCQTGAVPDLVFLPIEWMRGEQPAGICPAGRWAGRGTASFPGSSCGPGRRTSRSASQEASIRHSGRPIRAGRLKSSMRSSPLPATMAFPCQRTATP